MRESRKRSVDRAAQNGKSIINKRNRLLPEVTQIPTRTSGPLGNRFMNLWREPAKWETSSSITSSCNRDWFNSEQNTRKNLTSKRRGVLNNSPFSNVNMSQNNITTAQSDTLCITFGRNCAYPVLRKLPQNKHEPS